MTSRAELDKDTARAFKTEELCKDIAPWSLERWEFWRTRFAELVSDAEGIEVERGTVARIADASKIIEIVEGTSREALKSTSTEAL